AADGSRAEKALTHRQQFSTGVFRKIAVFRPKLRAERGQASFALLLRLIDTRDCDRGLVDTPPATNLDLATTRPNSELQPRDSVMEEEDRAADRIRSFTRWLDDAWEKNGRLGKLMILFLLVGIASPFILGVMAVVIVWVWIVPYAATVTDKVLAF